MLRECQRSWGGVENKGEMAKELVTFQTGCQTAVERLLLSGRKRRVQPLRHSWACSVGREGVHICDEI